MSDKCPTCGHPVSVRGSDEGTMHYVPSDKAQEVAQQAWDATHSLHSAVNAGCAVAVDEAIDVLRRNHDPRAVEVLERWRLVEAQHRLDAKAAADDRERGEL